LFSLEVKKKRRRKTGSLSPPTDPTRAPKKKESPHITYVAEGRVEKKKKAQGGAGGNKIINARNREKVSF